MALNDLLKMTFERKASDLHLSVGVPPILRVDGRLIPLDTEKRLTQDDTIGIAATTIEKGKDRKLQQEQQGNRGPGRGDQISFPFGKLYGSKYPVNLHFFLFNRQSGS
jgi:twitching motility protein PilT